MRTQKMPLCTSYGLTRCSCINFPKEMPTSSHVLAGQRPSFSITSLDNAHPTIFFNKASYLPVCCDYDCKQGAVLITLLKFRRQKSFCRKQRCIFSYTCPSRRCPFLVGMAPSITSKSIHDLHPLYLEMGVTSNQSLVMKFVVVTPV